MSSQRLTDYVALGTSGDRPGSLDLATGCSGFRWETDTGAWVWDGSNWVQFSGTDVGGNVSGPGSSSVGNIAIFDTTGGDNIDDSGVAVADVLVSSNIGTTVAAAPSGSADTPLFDDGSGGFTNGTRHGDTLDVATVDGSTTAGNAAVWDSDGNLIDFGSPPGSGGGGFNPITKTADYAVLSGDSGADFNNDGAGADIVLSLPAAAPNLIYGAAVHDANYIKFLADGTDQIAIGTDNSAAGGYVRSNAPFSYIELRCHVAGQWVASTIMGTWSIDA